MNLYVEAIESGQGKSAAALYSTPGLKLFCALSGPSVRGEISINGRVFSISFTNLYEVFADGTKKNLGTIADDGQLVSMAYSPQQLLIASAGQIYVLMLSTNVLSASIAGPPFIGKVSKVGFCDGFFLALIAESSQWYVSALFDATSWDGGDTTIISVFPDHALSMIISHREPWFCGSKASVVYYDSGNLFPFDVVQGAFIEQGIVAKDSIVNLDNSIFWLGGDERGNLIAWRANGYSPVRVSTHAVENAWQNFSTGADARAYAYQDRGHSFWVIYFPIANQTWVYDVATNLWHNRASLNNKGTFDAHHSQCHVFAFGKHLVGDWATGNIYEMNIAYVDDDGQPIKRIRRATHISIENQWMYHAKLQVDMETGIIPQPPLLDGSGNPRGPMAILRWSDDGGHTWSNEHAEDCGRSGEYCKRVIWRRLGRSRDRVYELSMTDPVSWRLDDAYLDANPAYKVTERLSDQLRKQA